jgi:hypothetical protein
LISRSHKILAVIVVWPDHRSLGLSRPNKSTLLANEPRDSAA